MIWETEMYTEDKESTHIPQLHCWLKSVPASYLGASSSFSSRLGICALNLPHCPVIPWVALDKSPTSCEPFSHMSQGKITAPM